MKHDIYYYKLLHGAVDSKSLKETQLRKAAYRVNKDFKQSLNWELVKVGDKQQEVLITRGENGTVKKIKSRPDEQLSLGALISWANTWWLVVQMDYDEQLHSAGVMHQCNVVLKWQTTEGKIHSVYGVAEDATKYCAGVNNTVYLETPSFSLKIKVPVNEETLAIQRNQRFLLGARGTNYQLDCFEVSRLNCITGTNKLSEENTEIPDGYIEITMREGQVQPDRDNLELGIADYIKEGTDPIPPVEPHPEEPIEIDKESGWFG